tara:strand:- start:228 stop:1136 length:909 start_codon:yes stop_codon:yes gene_type:complete
LKSFLKIVNSLSFTSIILVGASNPSIAYEIVGASAFKQHMPTVNKLLIENEISGDKIEGLCGANSTKCTIGINGEKIYTTEGEYINVDNIIAWTMTNATSKGGLFLISHNEDYRFLVKYFDKSGKRQITNIRFRNFKTAQTFLSHLELVVGLAPNHDQAGAATLCNARGKDILSGTAVDSINILEKQGYGLASRRNAFYGGATGALAGATLGSALSGGATVGVNTGAIVGGTIGAVSGNALGRASGGLSLKRNLVSEVRKTPAKSFAFSDGSFNHRIHCIDEPPNSTNLNIKNQIPLKIQNQ